MKVEIFYHSATGNTRLLAQGMEKRFQDLGADCGIRDIVGIGGVPDLSEFDIVGFGYPMMYWRPTYTIMDFIDALPFQNDKPAFVFCTMGGSPADSFYMMEKALDKRGLRTVGTLAMAAEDSHPFLRQRGVKGGSPWPTMARIDELHLFVRRMHRKGLEAQRDQKPRRCMIPRDLLLPMSWAGHILNRDLLFRTTGDKSVNVDACTRCGKCVKLCPARAIELDPTPKFSNRCIACWSCFNLCPTRAIVFSLAGAQGHYLGPDQGAIDALIQK